MLNSFTDKLSLHHKMILRKNDLYPQVICHKLEKRRADIFQDIKPKCNPFQSCPFVSIHASLSFCCISFMLFNSLEWL